MVLIKKFDDGSTISFGPGKFDEFCIHFVCSDGRKYFPKDHEYFKQLQILGDQEGREKIYYEFIEIFDRTGKDIDKDVISHIKKISLKYVNDFRWVERLYMILYAAMVAEENKANTQVGKRIKRLGVHQVLIENVDSEIAANFSRGMTAGQIDRELEKRISKLKKPEGVFF